MRLPGHGPGFRFHPTDEELTLYYLKRKVMGRKFHHDGIQEIDVYNLDPRDLKGEVHWKRDLKWYFFCPRERKYLTGERTKRSTEHGFWKTTGRDRPVYHKRKIVGMIKSLIFHERELKQAQRTDWVMHEYKLLDEYLKQLGCGEDAFVLCVIFEKEGPGPRNGAQYGAPYSDDDSDDADEEHEENTERVGALTQVHDSVDKGKSAVPNDFDRADGLCVGSSSRTLLSDIDHSVNQGFQPIPVLGTAVESQFPLTDQCDIPFGEVPLASLGHEQVKDIGVDWDANCGLTIPTNVQENIYGDLVDLCRLEDFPDYGVSACDNDSLANQKFPTDSSYMEVADCRDVSDSFECSHAHDHAGPEQPTCFGPVIPVGVLNPAFVDQQNLSDGISDITPSLNGDLNEPAHTDTSLRRCRNFPDSRCSEFDGPYLDQQFPVSEGSMGFNIQGSGGYGPFWQHYPLSDGLCLEDFEDGELYFNQHDQLAAGPIGFGGGQGFCENQLYSDPYHQFALGTNEFVSQSLRENVSPLHSPQFDEDLVWLDGQGSGQNGSQACTNGQMDRDLAGMGGAAPSGNVQPP